MKDSKYPNFKLVKGNCYSCILYTKSSNSCNHVNYSSNIDSLGCILSNGNLCYKIKLNVILKEL